MLPLADRGFFSYRLWDPCRSTGADLSWRMKSNAAPPIEKRYADGSFASHKYPGTKARQSPLSVMEATGASMHSPDRTQVRRVDREEDVLLVSDRHIALARILCRKANCSAVFSAITRDRLDRFSGCGPGPR